ncbi:MAG: ADP-heptose synthase, partial [Betaproteobacteria bacterium]|nr:ADP-heptose synthase [Betaproteobacteria bacterium]
VAGAGDSLLVCAGMALALGADSHLAAYLGSIAAAIQTSRIGNTPIKQSEMLKAIH